MSLKRVAIVPVALVAGTIGALAGGGLLGIGFARKGRPLHMTGYQWEGELQVDPPAERTGIKLVDHPGSHPVIFRVSDGFAWSFSRDIGGIGMRVWPNASDPTDVLMSDTGTSLIGRFVLHLRPEGKRSPFTTVMPFRTQQGFVWLRADADRSAPKGSSSWLLKVAIDRGPWCEWGKLTGVRLFTDDDVRFDPIGNTPRGARWPRWFVFVRDPAYRWARLLIKADPKHTNDGKVDTSLGE